MSRKRALKKRADYRGGGYVSRKKYNTGGAIILMFVVLIGMYLVMN